MNGRVVEETGIQVTNYSSKKEFKFDLRQIFSSFNSKDALETYKKIYLVLFLFESPYRLHHLRR